MGFGGGSLMVSVPYSERRYRIHGDEIGPVMRAVYADLLRRLRERDDRLSFCTLFKLRALRISFDPAVERLIEGVEVRSQQLVSVDIYETTQSPQSE